MAQACVVVPLGPACIDLQGIRAGDMNLMSVRLTQAGGPYDLTNKVVRAQARKTPIDTTALDAIVDVIDPTGGIFLMRWPGDQVTALLAGKKTWTGVWDVQVQSPPDDPLTVGAGAFKAFMDVTR